MTPRDKRDRIFKRSRPHIRPLEVLVDGEYHNDIKILWVAHKKSPLPFIDKDLNQTDFGKAFVELSNKNELLMVEDANSGFSKKGPIAVFSISSDGWKLTPNAFFFSWASTRNILRASVAYFQFIRYSRQIGACEVRTLKPSLLKRCETYGVIRYVGKIPNGSPYGDEHIFSVRGKKNGME